MPDTLTYTVVQFQGSTSAGVPIPNIGYAVMLSDGRFYSFFSVEGINLALWKMHKRQDYWKHYELLLKKLEPVASNLRYLDTIAWVYADHRRFKLAMDLYEKKIMPKLKNEKEGEIAKQYFDKYIELKALTKSKPE
jgi:hypothetical protein